MIYFINFVSKYDYKSQSIRISKQAFYHFSYKIPFAILYKNNNIVLDMSQAYTHKKANITGQAQLSNSMNPSTTSLSSQTEAYTNSSNTQKLEILKHLFKTIETQAARIKYFEMVQHRVQAQSEHNRSQHTIAAKLEEITRRREQSINKIIEDLRSQNQQLLNKISSLQSQKRNVKTQVRMPSFLEKFNTELKSKLGQEAEILKYKLLNQTIQRENEKLLKQLGDVKQQTDKFCNNFKKEYQELNTRYKTLQNGQSDLEKEVFRLKQCERKAQDHLKKARKQMEDIQTGSQLYFKYIVEILKQVTVLEAPEKWASFVNSLKQDDFSQESKRADIKKIIRDNSRKLVEVKSKLQKVEQFKTDLQRQSRSQQTLLCQKANELQLANKGKAQLQIKLNRQAAINSSLSQQKERFIQKNNRLQLDIKEQAEAARKLKLLIESLDEEKAKNKLTISSQQSQITKLQECKSAHEKTIQKLNGEIKALNQKTTSLVTTVNMLKMQIEGFNNQISQLKRQLQKRDKIIDSQSAEIRRLNYQISKKDETIQAQQVLIGKLQKEKSTLNDKIQSYQREIKQYSAELASNKYRIGGLETILSKISSDLVGQASHYYLGQGLNIKALTFQKLKDLDGEIQTLLSKWKDAYNRARFFNGSDIITRDNVGFIIESLDEYMGCLPYESKLVYKYDPLNLVNFHSYFDKVQNLIAFIRLTNGTVIGGFTVYPVDPDRIMRPGKGFLFSVTARKVYHIRSEPKLPVVSYDNYYFIFGNAEIRLKSQEKKMFSNFGIANSTFDNGTVPRTAFLNVSEVTNNELDIETYEFYRITFKA